METPPELEAKRRSYSQLSEYAECGERFRLKRVVKPHPPERPAAWLAHGNAFHEAYEAWELSGRTIDLKESYSVLYEAHLESMREIQPDLNLWLKPFRVKRVEEHIVTQKKRGLEQIDEFIELIDQPGWDMWEDPEKKLPGVEVPFDIYLGDIRVVGYIDFIREHEDGFSVLDFKTGNRVKSNTQLGLYKFVMEHEFGVPITHGEYFYTKDCTLTPPIDLSRYTQEYLTELYSDLDVGITNEVFLPNPGDRCDICPVKKYCREVGTEPIPLDFEKVVEPWWLPEE